MTTLPTTTQDNPNLILGLDPSLTSTGWSILDGLKKECLDWGMIKTDTKTIMVKRFIFIKEELYKLIKQYTIKFVGCEAPVFGGYETGTAYALYIGLQEVCLDCKVNLIYFAPSQLHKLLREEGYGTAGKIFKSDSVEAAKDFLKDKIPNRATGDKADSLHAARFGFRFWQFFNEKLDKDSLTANEFEMFTKTHTFVKGKKKGTTERKGIIHREDDLFFRFSKHTT
jgi:Holliday junction resolvasome RuvABC endonuclease subunit